LLTAFSQVYSKNWEQKAEQKDLSGQERSTLKVIDKKNRFVKEISIIKKKSSSLHWDNRKDALRSSQELARLHQSWAQGCEGFNSSESLGCPAHTGLLREVFPPCSAIQALRGCCSYGPIKPGYYLSWFCRHAECKSNSIMEASTQISKEGLRGQAMCSRSSSFGQPLERL
jgi:hypothetical protein